jgi:thioredoxin family protein
MMLRLFICLGWFASAVSLSAASMSLESMTVGSTTYSNVTVFGANTTDVFFNSDQGVSNVKLKFLSPELQRKFNYNSNAADKIEKQQIDDDKRYQQHLAELMTAKAQAMRDEREAQTKAAFSQAGLGDAISGESPLGQTAPALDFTNWFGAKPNLAGKLALISVWSPKSASSRKWIPAINELQKALAGKVEIVGVANATEEEVLQSEPKTDFPSALDPEAKFATEAGVTILPCVLLVDTNNVVRYLGHPAAITTNTLSGLLKGTEE